jgi:hypothetical protein
MIRVYLVFFIKTAVVSETGILLFLLTKEEETKKEEKKRGWKLKCLFSSAFNRVVLKCLQ